MSMLEEGVGNGTMAWGGTNGSIGNGPESWGQETQQQQLSTQPMATVMDVEQPRPVYGNAYPTQPPEEAFGGQPFNPPPPLLAANLEIGREIKFSMGTSSSNSTPRGLRSACDFCHTKRIKCKRDEGAEHCQQCVQRNLPCKFSLKEKTGPKPRPPGTGRSRSTSPTPNKSVSPKPRPSKSPVRPKQAGGMQHGHFTSASGGAGGAYWPAGANGGGRTAYPKLASEQIELETLFLRTYLATVGRLLPFCDSQLLQSALLERKRQPSPSSVPSSLAQAELAAVMAIGALICNERSAELYHSSARTHLKALFSGPSADAAPVLCMLAFYWQYQGEEEKKKVYLQHTKLGLQNRPPPPLDLQLCMEYLDYENSARLRTDGRSLTPRLRVLHVVSCVLADMQVLMDPTAGLLSAVSYCQELSECSVVADLEMSNELPALLCFALQAFLLVMLGRADEAREVLSNVPSLLGSNPLVIKAMPLAWDACLIASTLSFLLGQKQVYAMLHSEVERAQNATAATQWTCRLPSPDSSPPAFLNHMCMSTSNICAIICQIGRRTEGGTKSFYGSIDAPQGGVGAANGAFDGEDISVDNNLTDLQVDSSLTSFHRRKSCEVEGMEATDALLPGSLTPKRLKSSPGNTPTNQQAHFFPADNSESGAGTGSSRNQSQSPVKTDGEEESHRIQAPRERNLESDLISQRLFSFNLGANNMESNSGHSRELASRAQRHAMQQESDSRSSGLQQGGGSFMDAPLMRCGSEVSEGMLNMMDDNELLDVLHEWDPNENQEWGLDIKPSSGRGEGHGHSDGQNNFSLDESDEDGDGEDIIAIDDELRGGKTFSI